MSATLGPARWAMFVRSFAIQGSWNYRTLIGAGLAFTLLPGLRAIYRDDPDRLREAVRRHSELFNGHPYLVPLAVGALATMEQEGESPAVIERFKAAIRGSLGTLGDRLIWAAWRPACLLFALTLLLLNVPWWLVALTFLVLYDAGHLAVRIWAFRVGLRRGRAVGEHLRRSSVPEIQRVLSIVCAFLLGVLLPLVAAGRLTGGRLALPWLVGCALVVGLGVRFGEPVRRPILIALVGFALVGLLLETVV